MMIKRILENLFYYYNARHFLSLGEGTKINPTASVHCENLISIGKHSFIGKWCHISIVEPSSLSIGNFVCISPYVRVPGK